MYLIGDIGNSEIKICLVNKKNKIFKRINFSAINLSLKDLNKNLDKIKNYLPKVEKVLFCSVVPKYLNLIKRFLKPKTKVKFFEVKQLNLSSIIKIKVNYRQVGSDRITNAISLADNKKNYIIIDLGTATTFDVLIKNVYIGGIIAPGVKLSLTTLSDKASLIPNVNLKKIKRIIGNDTITAVRSGFFWGYAGLIDNIVNLIKKEARKSFKIIITGGFSSLFKNPIKTKVFEDKDITLKGLIRILQLIK